MCELDSAAACHHHAQVSQRLGIPTAEYEATTALNQAQGLQCAGFWAVQVVYNVDLDAQGQVQAVTQALDEGPAFDGVIWTWRYRLAPWHRLLHMDLNPQSVPRHWQAMDDPRYDRWFERSRSWVARFLFSAIARVKAASHGVLALLAVALNG